MRTQFGTLFLACTALLTATATTQSLLGESGKLIASDGASSDRFGTSVAVDGDTLVIGATNAQAAGLSAGAAYVFTRTTSSWTDAVQVARLTGSQGTFSDDFGSDVAIHEDTIVVGARRAEVDGVNQGAAYVFEKPAGGWTNMTETAKLFASNGHALDSFGISVAISGDTIVVGAYLAGAPQGQGKVYVFERSPSGWVSGTEIASLVGVAQTQLFGNSVAIEGDTIVASAPGPLFPRPSGMVAVYEKPPSGWGNTSPAAVLDPLNPGITTLFGDSVALDGSVIAVGDPWAKAVYVFEEPQTGWASTTETAKLTASGAGGNVGAALALDGTTILSGAPETFVGCSVDGRAYLFEKSGTWLPNESSQFLASEASAGLPNRAGNSVAMDNTTLFVGTPFAETNGVNDTGAVYIFETPYAPITPPSPTLSTTSLGTVDLCKLPAVIVMTGSTLCQTTSVLIGGTSVPVTNVSDTSVSFTVTNAIAPGTYAVTASGSLGTSNAMSLTILPTATPVLTDVSPAVLVNRSLPQTLTLTGSDMNCVTSVQVGAMSPAILSQTSSSLTISFPSGLTLGSYQVTVDSSQGTSNAVAFDVVGSHPSVLVASGLHPGGATRTYRTWTDAGWTVQYLLSAVDGTTAIPGILSLEIGGGAFANVVPIVALAADGTGVADLQVTMPPGLPVPLTLYWECMTIDPSVPLGLQAPLETSNRVAVLTLF